mgnify:CR=1 FL=1
MDIDQLGQRSGQFFGDMDFPQNSISQKLDRLAVARADYDRLQAMQEKLMDEAIPAEVKVRLDEIEAEFGPAIQAAANGIALLEIEIKTAVIQAGASAKGGFLQAIYSKGRVSWDTKALEGVAAVHPELLQFRSVGAPSVSIRVVK